MTPGQRLYLTVDASPYFAARPIVLQVVAVQSWESHTGWVWVDGWELDDAGAELIRRAVYIRVAGVAAVP